MAGKLKKGFTTYLLVLFIALVAAFLISITVMLFSPFKNVLGLKYFVYNSEVYEYKATGESDDLIFDFANLKEIQVDCNYGNIIVESSKEVDSYAIKFTNKSKGFARENQNTDFKYNLYWVKGYRDVLGVSVQEPEGFLYFSKEIEISILIPKDAPYALENTKINLINTSGNITLGNNGTKDVKTLDINSLSVKTNSGEFFLYPNVDGNFNEFFVKSNKGEVEIKKDIKVDNGMAVHSESGKVKFNNITATNIVLNIENSNFKANTITGQIDLAIKSGYLDIKKIDGNIVSNDANSQMSSANVMIGEVTGAASFPFVNKSMIKINTLSEGGEFYSHSTSGNIEINKAYGKIYAETVSGDVNVVTYANDIQVKTKSGDINVAYNPKIIENQLDLATETGKVNLKVSSELAFTLVVYDTEGKLRENGIIIDWFNGKFENPTIINGGTNKIVIFSNSDVNVSLI